MRQQDFAPAAIGLVTGEYPPRDGGVGACAHGLAHGLDRLGLDVRLVAPRYGESDRATDALLGLPISRVYQGRIGPLRHLARLRRLAAVPRAGRYVAMDWRAALSALPLARARRVPLSVWCYGTELLRYQGSPSRRVMQAVFKAGTQVIAISHYTAGLAIEAGVDPARIVVIPPGIELAPPDPREVEALRQQLGLAGHRILLTLSRVVPRKGHDLVIRALPRLRQRFPDLLYVVAGGGDVARLRHLASDLGVEDLVRFAGRVPAEQKAAYYGLCDVFVMPSRQEGPQVEGFGISFVEAGACGKPVVAGNHGGVPDAVRDGVSGFLVDPASPSETEHALRRLLADSRLARSLGANGQRLARDEFQWPLLARKLAATWPEVSLESARSDRCAA